jgi:hypothetical protein
VIHLVSSKPDSGNDPGVPNLVWALDGNKTRTALVADSSTIRRLEDGGLNAKIGEYCGLIHGAVEEGFDLMRAHALFRGLKRPCTDVGRDTEIFVYVLDPSHTFVFPRRAKYSGGGPTISRKPLDSVFVVYADLKPMEVDFKSRGPTPVGGMILFWEWVLADPSAPNLPKDYLNRYGTQVW